MAKLSRSGKKKRSVYKTSAKEQQVAATKVEDNSQATALGKRLSAIALVMLLVSMGLLLFAGRFPFGESTYKMYMYVAYGVTSFSGALMVLSAPYSAATRKKTVKFTGYAMIALAVYGMYTVSQTVAGL